MFSINDVISPEKIAAAVTGAYHNSVIANVNDHVVRVSVMTEDFYWHYHPNSDETFMVIDGTLLLDLEERILELNKGEMFTVPKNVIHRTRPKNGRSVNVTIELSAMQTIKVEG